MKNFARRNVRRLAKGAAALALCMPAFAAAQNGEGQMPAEEAEDSDEIVVTGSLIRGAAPVGSNLIAVGPDTLQTSGAATSNELLATIPQVTNYFNRVPAADLSIIVSQFQITRPNIRNISPKAAASSATLILFDGHRIASAGTKQASVDPDVIPTGAIERVEVVTEGGSAVYGADAVAGVINFITRKRFDGVKADARYGVADEYWQLDANATAGKDWGDGSAYISYTYTKNRTLFGGDRDFVRRLNYASLPYAGLDRQCDLANVRFTTPVAANFAVQNLTIPGVNTCDISDEGASIPAAERHGVVASLYQELSPATTVEAKAFYGERVTKSRNTYRGTISIGTNNPFYRNVPSRPGQTQTVDFSLAPALGPSTNISSVLIQEWGANIEMKQKITDDWQVRGLLNFSRSNTEFSQPGVNSTRLNAAGNAPGLTTTTAFNPYDVSSTNSTLISDLIDNESAGQAKDELLDLRLIADGHLVTLPGGDVRLALGYEFMNDRLMQREVANVRLGGLANAPFNKYNRNVHSLFGELNLPIVGGDNASPGFESLVISAQGRYDRYSDFGGTFNPKLGATFKPFPWLSLRGNWGTSFTAPSPLDQLNARSFSLTFFSIAALIRPEDRLAGVGPQTATLLALQGSQANLQPQTAKTWSVGFDIEPPASGFRASLSYYNVSFDDIIATPTPSDAIYNNFPSNVQTRLPSLGGIPRSVYEALIQPGGLAFGALGGQAAINAAVADGRPVYAIVDFRVGNFGQIKVDGLDFGANYTIDFDFGSLDLSVNGNYVLNRKSLASPGAPAVDELAGDDSRAVDGSSRLSLQSAVGATIGQLRAQVTWNHTSGYGIPPTPVIAVQPSPPVPIQDRVRAFDTVNVFLKYDLSDASTLTKDLSLTLNVTNLFDRDPPFLLRNGQNENGYTGGFTIGRMLILGLSKRF